MAGDWIKMRGGLESEPEVVAISSALDIDEDSVVGKLYRLWTWADQKTVNGNAPGVTRKWLDRFLGVSGITEALISVGWISFEEPRAEYPLGALVIPGFDKHNSQSAKTRALTNDRVAKHREKTKLSGNKETVTETVTRVREEQEKSNTKKAKDRSADALAVLKKLRQKKFTVADLGDSSRILDAYEIVTGKPENLVKASDANLRWAFCVAVHCVDASRRKKKPVDNPGGLFCSMLVDQSSEGITNDQQDRAMQLLASHQRAGPSREENPAMETVRKLAESKASRCAPSSISVARLSTW